MATKAVGKEPPLVVIAGPTASGKTALAIDLAKQFCGEIICADSRTIYKYMDIGTAKPTLDEREQVPHWGLDLVEPGERFTAADFKTYALNKIIEIRSRGHVPFLVGGTGLYINAVVFDYEFGLQGDEQKRRKLEALTIDQLHEYCEKDNVRLPENKYNKRYVIRAIEKENTTERRRPSPLKNTIVVGIATDKETLRSRIAARAEQLFNNGVVEEATLLGKKYGWNNEAMTGNVYPLVHTYLENNLTYDEMKEKFTTLDWRLAKRQITWLRRNPYIYWGNVSEVRNYVAQRLASN
jgi:tRNA dimethylallyltransferase